MIRQLLFICLWCCAALWTPAPAYAVVERDCVVAIQAKSGWSRERKSTVHFMTGLELSRITTVLPVEFHQIYAVISQDGGLPTVVRLDAVVPGVRRDFTDADFIRLFAYNHEWLATQIDGEGRNLKWLVRGRTSRGWVDDEKTLVSGVSR